MNTTTNKNKKSALGRGLGSLLGSDEPQQDNTEGSINIPQIAENTNLSVNKKVEERVLDKEKTLDPRRTVHQKKEVQIQTTSDKPSGLGQQYFNIAIEKIVGNKEQPRKKFDKEKLEQLSQSIKENGVIQPITVKKIHENKYEIIAGERRWRASQLAGVHYVPAIVKDLSEQKTLEVALVENIQRENLNVVEEAFAYKNLMDQFDLTQSEVAEKVGKDRATVANLVRVLNLGPEVREMLKNDELSLGHAKLLLSVSDIRLQFKIARKVIKSGLSVKQTNKLIKRLQGAKVLDKEEVNSGIHKQIKNLEQEMQKILGTKVKLNYDKGKSKLNIQFYTVSELNNFVNNLRDNWNK